MFRACVRPVAPLRLMTGAKGDVPEQSASAQPRHPATAPRGARSAGVLDKTREWRTVVMHMLESFDLISLASNNPTGFRAAGVGLPWRRANGRGQGGD